MAIFLKSFPGDLLQPRAIFTVFRRFVSAAATSSQSQSSCSAKKEFSWPGFFDTYLLASTAASLVYCIEHVPKSEQLEFRPSS